MQTPSHSFCKEKKKNKKHSKQVSTETWYIYPSVVKEHYFLRDGNLQKYLTSRLQFQGERDHALFHPQLTSQAITKRGTGYLKFAPLTNECSFEIMRVKNS